MEKILLEQVLPRDIEKRSFEIITEELGDRKFPKEQESIIKRVIHTSADFDYADNLCFSENAVALAKQAIMDGACIVTDTQMAKAGINKRSLKKFGGEADCKECGITEEDSRKKMEHMWNTMYQASCAYEGNLRSKSGFVGGDGERIKQYVDSNDSYAGAMNAIAAADMALAGVESRIPVDQVIDAMREIGDAMPMQYKETACGGCAATEWAKQAEGNMRNVNEGSKS